VKDVCEMGESSCEKKRRLQQQKEQQQFNISISSNVFLNGRRRKKDSKTPVDFTLAAPVGFGGRL
jgi:hypothetical protein